VWPREIRSRVNGRDLPERRHIAEGSIQHGTQDRLIDSGVFVSVLPRRTDEQLAIASWLNIECHRIRSNLVRALQIPKFDQLVTEKVRIRPCEYQVSFTFLNRQPRQQRSLDSGSKHDRLAMQFGAVAQLHHSLAGSITA
jgi:hypothetical protein